MNFQPFKLIIMNNIHNSPATVHKHKRGKRIRNITSIGRRFLLFKLQLDEGKPKLLLLCRCEMPKYR